MIGTPYQSTGSTPSPYRYTTSNRLSPINLLQLPDEIIIYIISLLLPIPASTTFPPITTSSNNQSYSQLIQSHSLIQDLPRPHPVPKSIFAFLQVSKKAYQLAIPLLYNAITLQTITSTNRLASTLLRNRQLGSFVQHLNLSNDGLLHGQSDRMADKATWLESLRNILQLSSHLQNVSIATRPGGEALQELINYASSQDQGMAYLKRLTISSLSFSPPMLGAASLHAPKLTHLHLIQWIPPTLSERFGPDIYESLQVLRLSRIPSSILRSTTDLNDQYQDRLSAQQTIDQSIRLQPQPLLLLLQHCIEQYTNLHCILLEFEQLADLDIPEGLLPVSFTGASTAVDASTTSIITGLPAAENTSLTSTGGFGAPFDQFAAGHLGALASLDYPADIPLTLDESDQWPQLLEENRCKERLRHWSRLLQFRNLLIRYSREMRDNDDHLSDLEIRIAAPRPMGWDRNDSLNDFYSNARACQGEEDYSAFQDPDVFELVDQYSHLGHDFASDRAGNRVAYWTGALPRRN